MWKLIKQLLCKKASLPKYIMFFLTLTSFVTNIEVKHNCKNISVYTDYNISCWLDIFWGLVHMYQTHVCSVLSVCSASMCFQWESHELIKHKCFVKQCENKYVMKIYGVPQLLPSIPERNNIVNRRLRHITAGLTCLTWWQGQGLVASTQELL